jgi:hypothetical protein
MGVVVGVAFYNPRYPKFLDPALLGGFFSPFYFTFSGWWRA